MKKNYYFYFHFDVLSWLFTITEGCTICKRFR